MKLPVTTNVLVGVSAVLAIVMSAITVKNIVKFQKVGTNPTRKNAIIKLAFSGLVLLLSLSAAMKVYMRKGNLKNKVVLLSLLCTLLAVHSMNIIYYYSVTVYDTVERSRGILAIVTINRIKKLNYAGIVISVASMALMLLK